MPGTGSPARVPVRTIGGPTALISYGGLNLLTDPTFDAPADHPVGNGTVITKTAPPSAAPADLGPIDAVLLSHDEHPDNLDVSGRALLADVPLTLTTRGGAERLGGTARSVRGLAPWEDTQVTRPGGGTVTVTAVPALHGPEGAEEVLGEVIGFVLTGDGLPKVYVSGDNASLDLVRQVAGRFGPVDTAVLFAGAARAPMFDTTITLDSAQAAEAARILGAHQAVPVHFEGWTHFTEGREELKRAFTAAGLSERLDLV
ncbi:MBL fold metallo-hydrolase [Nocardiopsis sp. RSe5-2]|uniref:MBL fold metallo-hydrolase n=1 Tax=Nocardiopsis endophytica TaxID=3018445 RepID=A0ABT4U724_9ACTN|nr:MBL fold metallo-hydrolase [Nocardiopsis endophytica]MDA2812762.1 MBL fold metallo-hydrolase [Nocardiopsis endophytica]